MTLEFTPKLDDSDIRNEACKVAVQMREKREKEEEEKRLREAEEAEAKQQEEEKVKNVFYF